MNCQHDDTLNSNGGGAKPNPFLSSYESLNISKNSSAEEIAEKYLRSKLSLDFKNIGKASYNASGGAHRDFYEDRNAVGKSNIGRTANGERGHFNGTSGQTSYHSRANDYSRPERKTNTNHDSHFNNVSIFSESGNTNSGGAGNLHFNYCTQQNDQSRGYTNSVLLSNNMTNFFSSTNSASPTDFTHLTNFKEEKKNSYYVEEDHFLKFGQTTSKALQNEDPNKVINMNSIGELLKKYGSSGIGSGIGIGSVNRNGINIHTDVDGERTAGSNTQPQRRFGGDANPIFHRPSRREKNSEGTKIKTSLVNKAEAISESRLGRESNKTYYSNRMNRFVGDTSQGSSKKKNLMQRNKDYVHYLSNRNSILKNEVSIRKDLGKKKGVPSKFESTYLRRKTNVDGMRRHGSLFSSVLRGYQSRCNNENEPISNMHIFNNSHVEAAQNSSSYRGTLDKGNSNLSGRGDGAGNCFAGGENCFAGGENFFSGGENFFSGGENFFAEGKSGHTANIGSSAINMSFLKSTYSNSSKLVNLPVNGDTSRSVNGPLNSLTNDSSDLMSLGRRIPAGELFTRSVHMSALYPSKDTSRHYNDLSSKPEMYGALYGEGDASGMMKHTTTVRGEPNGEYFPPGDAYHEKANTSGYEKKLPPTGEYLVRSGEKVPIRNCSQSIRSGSVVGSIHGRGSNGGKFLGYVGPNSGRSDGEKGVQNFLHPLYLSEKKLSNIFNNKVESNNLISSNVSVYNGEKREGSVRNCSERRSSQNKITHGGMLNSGVSYAEGLPGVASKEKKKKKHMNQVGSIQTYEDYCKYITESINGIPITTKNIDVLLALALYFLSYEIHGNPKGSELPDQVLIKLLNKFLYCLNLKTCLLKDNLGGGKLGDSNKYYYIQIRKNEKAPPDEEEGEEKKKEEKEETEQKERENKEETETEEEKRENVKGDSPDGGVKTTRTDGSEKRDSPDQPNQVNLFTFYNKRIVLEKKDQEESRDENPTGLLPNQSHFCQDGNYKKKCFYFGENMKIITLVDILKIAWCLCVLKKNMHYVDLLRILYKEVECMRVSKELAFCVSYLFKYCNIIHVEECKIELNKHVHLRLEESSNENLCMYLHLLHICSAQDKSFLTHSHRKNVDRIVAYFYDRVESISLYACTNILCALSKLDVKNGDYPYFFHKTLNYFRSNIKKLTKCVLLVNILWSLCLIEVCCTDFFKDLSEYIINILHFLPLGDFITISCCFSCQKMLIVRNYLNYVRKTGEGKLEQRCGVTVSSEREYRAYEPVVDEYYAGRKLFPYCFYRRPVCHALVFKILAYGFLQYEQREGGEALSSEVVPREAVPREAVPCEAVHGEFLPGELLPGEPLRDHADRSGARRKTCRSLSVENSKGGSSSGARDSSAHSSRLSGSRLNGSRFNSSSIYRAGASGGLGVEARNEVQKNKYPKKISEKKKIKEHYNMYERTNKYEFALNSCERILFENLIEDCCNNFQQLNCHHLVELLFTLCTLNLDRCKIVKLAERKINCLLFEENYEKAVKKKKSIHKDLTEEEKKNERNDLIILNYIYNKYVQESSHYSGRNDIDEGFLQMVDNVYLCRYIRDDSFLRVIKTSKGLERTNTGAFSKLRHILNAATVSRESRQSRDGGVRSGVSGEVRSRVSGEVRSRVSGEVSGEVRSGTSSGHVGKTNSEKELPPAEGESMSSSHHSGSDPISGLRGGIQERQHKGEHLAGNVSNQQRGTPLSGNGLVGGYYPPGGNIQMGDKLVERPDEIELLNGGDEYAREGGDRSDHVGDTPRQLSKFQQDLKHTYDAAISYCNKRTNHLGNKGTLLSNSGGADRALQNGHPQQNEHFLNHEIYDHIVTKRNIKNIMKRHKEKGMIQKIFSSPCGDNAAQVGNCEREQEKHSFNFYRTFILLLQLSALSLLSFVVLFVYTSLR